MGKNPVEVRLERLRQQWLLACEDPAWRLLVWRLPASGARLLAAFFEMQKQPGDWQLPDYFLRLDCAFETGFGYSRELKQALSSGYLGSQQALREQGVAPGWRGVLPEHPDSATGAVEVFESFAAHHREHFRHLVVVLEPERIVADEAFMRWTSAALAALRSGQVRLVLVDRHEDPRWQPLLDRHGGIAVRLDAPLDMFEVARETAAQSGGGAGPGVVYRQWLADLMTLLERGSPAQVAQRAERALAVAQRHGWQDQQAAVHMMVAGGWLKGQDHARAIGAYRQARELARQAAGAGNPAGASLAMQSWFGEAGAWLAAGQPVRAAQGYLGAAEAAAAVPHPMFVIEGQRMAGFCLAQDGQREAARERGLEAIRQARPLSPEDRRATTLPLALWDLLMLQDRPRAQKLEQCAAAYLEQVGQLHVQAEAQADKLGQRPPRERLDRIESELHAGLEQAFHRVAQERERLIQGGDAFFQKVVAVARDFLDPAWNGLPEIHHPLDHEVAAWTQPPAMLPLPDASDLTQVPAAPAPAQVATAAEATA